MWMRDTENMSTYSSWTGSIVCRASATSSPATILRSSGHCCCFQTIIDHDSTSISQYHTHFCCYHKQMKHCSFEDADIHE